MRWDHPVEKTQVITNILLTMCSMHKVQRPTAGITITISQYTVYSIIFETNFTVFTGSLKNESWKSLHVKHTNCKTIRYRGHLQYLHLSKICMHTVYYGNTNIDLIYLAWNDQCTNTG